MMTVQEAIEGFKMDNTLLAGTNETATVERNNMAISALEKQVGKKPGKLDVGICAGELLVPSCAVCNNPMFYLSIGTRPNYCPKCGQAICWDVTEDEDEK